MDSTEVTPDKFMKVGGIVLIVLMLCLTHVVAYNIGEAAGYKAKPGSMKFLNLPKTYYVVDSSLHLIRDTCYLKYQQP